MKKRLVIFHPAIAPYRIDFFNSLYDAFETCFYFEHRSPLEQSFNLEELNKRIHFPYSYLSPGLWKIKNLRIDVIKILRREKPDIVFVSEYTILGLLVLLYKFFFNWSLRIIITCDDNLDMAILTPKVSLTKHNQRLSQLRTCLNPASSPMFF